MNLGEALNLLKKERSRLSRLIELRKDNLYVEEGKRSEFDLEKISKDIDLKIENIRKLKMQIQRTNLATRISSTGRTVAETIIEIGDIRSKIASLGRLFENRRFLYCEIDEKPRSPQMSASKVEEEIEKLESQKTFLDNQIQIVNWSTPLLEG